MRAILHDVTRCDGCMECVERCSARNGTPVNDSHCDLRRGELSAERLTTVIRTPEGRWVRRHCHHCIDPSCAAACLVGALRKTPEGPVVYDAGRCIGCRYCMLACPLGFPRYQWDTATPRMKKCDMCFDRPGGPLCAGNCPQKAVVWGEREEVLAIARDRIRSAPDRYIDHVWGEKEMGGTCVLFVSDVPLDGLWPEEMGTHSIPELTRPFVNKTPFIALAMAGGLSVMSWVISRRNRLMAGKKETE